MEHGDDPIEGRTDATTMPSATLTADESGDIAGQETPARTVSHEMSAREFSLRKTIFELERCKVELDIEIAQSELLLERKRQQQGGGERSPNADPHGQNALEENVDGFNNQVDPGRHACVEGRETRWRSQANRVNDPASSMVQHGPAAATMHRQPGPSHVSYSADIDFASWRRAVDERYGFNRFSSVGQSSTRVGEATVTGQRSGQRYSLPFTTAPHYNSTFAESLTQSQIAARKTVGKEIPTFAGDARHWPLFIASFEKSSAICGYSDEENLLRLQRALRGPALDAVEHLLLLPGGLDEVMRTLYTRFGRPDLVVDALVERVRSLPSPRMERLETLVTYGTAIKNLCATIRISGLQEYQCSVTLMKELTVKLPPALRLDWARHKQLTLNTTLLDFGNWVGELADAASGEIPSSSRPASMSGTADQRVPPKKSWATTHSIGAKHGASCAACEERCAALPDCRRFRAMDLAARNAVVRKSKVCRNCLRLHRGACRAKGCDAPGCERKHHRLLHDDCGDDRARRGHTTVPVRNHEHHDTRRQNEHKDTAMERHTTKDTALERHTTKDTHGSNDSTGACFTHTRTPGALLRYVPIILYGKRANINTFALLDDGSTPTLIDKELIDELGLSGTASPLCLNWTGNTTREEADSVEVCLKVSGVHKSASMYRIPKVHTVRSLSLPAQTLSVKELADSYSHLNGIPADSYENAKPRVLIGVEHCHLFKALEYIEGKWGEPVAAKTRLGWTIFGPSPSASPGLVAYPCYTTTIADDRLNEELRQYFSMDAIGIVHPTEPLRSKDEARALIKNAKPDRFASKFPRAAECIKYEHYVDDLLASVETEREALTLVRDVRYIHDQGEFEIRNLVSNVRKIVQLLCSEAGKSSQDVVQMMTDTPTKKVLGLWWDTAKDMFVFRISPRHDSELLSGARVPTKRELLRFLMMVYDPLGLIGHYLMGLKMILQDAWRSGRQWDDTLDDGLARKWTIWVATLPALQAVSIPCCYRSLTPPASNVQLHTFCDAGEGGMAAVTYFRFDSGQVIECTLIGSKTRVAPVKLTSVPRLELQAAVIGARFAQHIMETQRIRFRHRNHQTVLNEIRTRFIVPKLRVEHNRIRRSCQLCRVWNTKPHPPLMGNIPLQRVGMKQRPFTYCGVDYFGPINVVVGRRHEKRWGVIFTCLTIRAIHIEIAHSLTTDSCIMAIRRFIASRGRPREIISDRGTNFIGSSRELCTVFNSPDLQWSFNPPGAPHFGGCWERLIRSVKGSMARMNLPRVPTDEVLYTSLKEIELIINSRPLTYVPVDDEDAHPITPNHFLLGSSNGEKPPAMFDDSSTAVRSSWKAAQQNANQFWTLWVKTYLPTLTRRTKWDQPTRPIEIGDVIIIVDNTLPRNRWVKGRVINTVQAADGQVRRATVKTANGTIERPATKIAIIDVRPRGQIEKQNTA